MENGYYSQRDTKAMPMYGTPLHRSLNYDRMPWEVDMRYSTYLRAQISHQRQQPLPPSRESEIYLQDLGEYVAGRSGVLEHGWQVRFEFCPSRCKTSAIFYSPNGRRFESMSAVADFLGLAPNGHASGADDKSNGFPMKGLKRKTGANNLEADVDPDQAKIVDLEFQHFCKLAIELVTDHGDPSGLRCENFIQAIPSVSLSSDSNLEYLKSGLEDYVLKHSNRLPDMCHSCFSGRNYLKVGTGVACCSKSSRNNGQVMEAVIIISDLSELKSPLCFQLCGPRTEVLYFKDFSPCLISKSSLNALTSIDWKSYGLTLRRNSDENSDAFLEWENLPLGFHINIALHHYQEQVVMPPAKQRALIDRSLTRKAVKLALDDLKEKNAGVLLTAQAQKIRSFAPDLASTLAGLILSSNDANFQGECLSLLGLQSQAVESEMVESCIKERLIAVMDRNEKITEK